MEGVSIQTFDIKKNILTKLGEKEDNFDIGEKLLIIHNSGQNWMVVSH